MKAACFSHATLSRSSAVPRKAGNDGAENMRCVRVYHGDSCVSKMRNLTELNSMGTYSCRRVSLATDCSALHSNRRTKSSVLVLTVKYPPNISIARYALNALVL